jgi:hypothetical protein
MIQQIFQGPIGCIAEDKSLVPPIFAVFFNELRLLFRVISFFASDRKSPNSSWETMMIY